MAGIPIVTVILQFRHRNEGGIARHLDRQRFVVHQFGEGRFDGLSPGLCAGRARVQQVPHQIRIDGAIHPQKDLGHIQPEHLFAIGQPRGELPGATAGFDTLHGRVERRGAQPFFAIAPARENPQNQNPGGRMTSPDKFHNRLGAGRNLLRRVDFREMPVVAVVGADEEYYHLRRLVEVEFAILQVPKDLLGAIAVMPQIDGVARREMPLPYSLEGLILAAEFAERVGDGIPDQHQVVVAGFDRRDLLRMARARCRGWKIGIARFGRYL